MKKILALLLAAVMCVSLVACGSKEQKIYLDDVLSLYETIEVTEENIMEFFDLVEVEQTDIFGDSTGEKELLLNGKEGYFPDYENGCALRVTYTITTIKYAEGSERPEFPMENIEDNEFVVEHSTKERDIQLHLEGLGEYLETSYSISDGYIYETQITDFTILKATGNVVTYKQSEIDNLFSVDDSGKKSLTVWKDDTNNFVIDESVVGQTEDVYMVYKVLYLNLVVG